MIRTPMWLWLSVVLATDLLAVEPAAAIWREVARVTDREAQVSGEVVWRGEDGLALRIGALEDESMVVLDLKDKQAKVKTSGPRCRPYVESAAIFFPERLPLREGGKSTLQVHLGVHTWRFYLDGALCAELPAGFSGGRSLAIHDTDLPPDAVAFRVQKTGDFLYRESFMQEPDGPDPMASWEAVGEAAWHLHTAHEDAIADPNSKKLATDPLLPDFSPNFYSLTGAGKGYLLRGYSFLDALSVAAAVRVQPGTSGLISHWRGPEDFLQVTLTCDATRDEGELALVSSDSRRPPHLRTLARQQVALSQGGWVKLELRTQPDRGVQALIDGVVILEEDIEVPPSGRFGLYSGGAETVRFDDIEVHRDTSPALRNLADWRRETLADPYGMLVQHGLFAVPMNGDYLNLAKSREERWLAVGPDDAAHYRFGASFEPAKGAAGLGLVLGVQPGRTGRLRFSRQQEGETVVWRLLRDTDGREEVLATRRYKPLQPAAATVRLEADLHDDRMLRLFEDGRLVLATERPADIAGGAGIWLEAGYVGRVHTLRWQDEPPREYRNQYEKNRNFVKDPFMRHWSSPEGEWLADAGVKGRYWFKGDCFDRMELTVPVRAGGKAGFGALRGQPEVGFRLEMVGEAAAKEVQLRLLGPGADAAPIAEGTLAVPVATDAAIPKTVQIIREGLWCWAFSGDRLLWCVPLDPAAGRLVWLEGIPADALDEALVDRTQVADFLFAQAPTDWVVNGGSWRVTNRFQCQPRWSHMTATNDDGLAASWSKLVFEGDFCVEMYAGLRHYDYSRCGDLNITIGSMEDAPSAGSGYTVVTTGWDRDESQIVTRLLRNGQELARSDLYTVPRRREGNERRSQNPLIAAGRPVHGAWYYIKFRRVGNKLEYWFDNQLVFEVEDSKPIEAGRLGIWTYRNEMVVARVKVAARNVRQARSLLPALELPGEPVEAPAPAVAGVDRDPRLLVDGGSGDWLAPERWQINDDVGGAVLRQLPDAAGGEDALLVVTELGGGGMQLRTDGEQRPLSAVAGWQMQIARGADTRLHAWFVIGESQSKGKVFKVSKRYCHLINGEAPRPDVWTAFGRTDIPAGELTARNGVRESDWRTVNIWLPITADLAAAGSEVRFMGLGVFEPGDADMGLSGNGPGAWYAVRGVQPIFRQAPVLTVDLSRRSPQTLVTINDVTGAVIRRGREADVVLGAAMRLADTFNRARIRTVGIGSDFNDVLISYLNVTAPPAVVWSWHPERAGTLVATPAIGIPDVRLAKAAFQAVGNGILPDWQPDGSAWFELPADLHRADHPDGLVLTCKCLETESSATLSWSTRRRVGYPRLVSMAGLPVFESFELPGSELKAALRASTEMSRRTGPADNQGHWLEISNNGEARRLTTTLTIKESLARYPLLAIHHRAGPMVNLSAALGAAHKGRLSEKQLSAPELGLYAFDQTRRWQQFVAMPILAIATGEYSADLFDAGTIRLASLAEPDQTGLYAPWQIDTLLLGPAVSDVRNVSLVPNYLSTEPIDQIEVAELAGLPPWDERRSDEQAAVQWRTVAPGQAVVPALAQLPDGVNRVLMRAVDRDGRKSEVTEIPILVDRAAPKVTAHTVASTSVDAPGFILALDFPSAGGAPLDLSQLKLHVEGRPLPMMAGATSFRNSREALRIYLNWPVLLGAGFDASSKSLTVEGIVDGAGNVAPAEQVSLVPAVKVTPRPIYTAVQLPESVLLSPPGVLFHALSSAYEPDKENKTSLERTTDEPPFTSTRPDGELGLIFLGAVAEGPGDAVLVCEIRHPKLKSGETGRIYADIMHGKEHRLVSLNAAAVRENPEYGQAATLLSDDRDVWQTIVVPVPEKGGKVQVGIRRKGVKLEQPLHIRNAWLVRPWGDAATVGVRGVSATPVDAAEFRVVTGKDEPAWQAGSLDIPRGLLSGPLGSWLEIRLRDRGGNMSLPLRIPRMP